MDLTTMLVFGPLAVWALGALLGGVGGGAGSEPAFGGDGADAGCGEGGGD